MSQHDYEQKPNITVVGVGGAGGNAVNNMIESNLEGVDFVVANTDAQALKHSLCQTRVQLGTGLGAGAVADVGRQAAEDSADDIRKALEGANMAFITAGMGGGTGTGAAPVVAKIARDMGILTIGVVTKPFNFEGAHRMRSAEKGIEALEGSVDTMIMIPNQNLFRVCDANTTFADAFKMADSVLHAGVRSVTDLIVMPGLINLDFADIRSVMHDMGKAMMGMGEASGEDRATKAAQAAITNPLLDDVSMQGALGVLINITGGMDMTLFEVDEVANRVREEVDPEAQIIFGSAFDESLEGTLRVSVVATGFDREARRRRQEAESAKSAHPFTVVAGDKAAKSSESDASGEVPDDGDLTPDWLTPVAEEKAPESALDAVSAAPAEAEPEETVEPASLWAEDAVEDVREDTDDDVQDVAGEDDIPEDPAPEVAVEEPKPVALEADELESQPGSGKEGVEDTLVEDVTDWLTKAYIKPADEVAEAAETAEAEQPVAVSEAPQGNGEDLSESLSKIWNDQGGSKSNGSAAPAAKNGNGASNGVDVSSLFLEEKESDEAEAGGDTLSLTEEDLVDVSDGASQHDEDAGDGPSGNGHSGNGKLEGHREDEEVSIEVDDEVEETDEALEPRRASAGFFGGLRRSLGKPTRDEQTGKAVLERLRGCQRLNTGEA